MRFLILLAIVAIACSSPLVVTRNYVEQLKRTVEWEVEEYENNIFRGLTEEDVKSMLGYKPKDEQSFPQVEEVATPSQIDWSADKCDVGPKNQGNCGSCWAFAAVGSLSARCCLHATDQGWLSPQELVSCDKESEGCNGGDLESPVTYAQKNGGLVPEACYPYLAKNAPCPNKCKNGDEWKKAHVCKCDKPTACNGVAGIKACLATGPVTIGFYVC
jgi:C1A family cysteine protease